MREKRLNRGVELGFTVSKGAGTMGRFYTGGARSLDYGRVHAGFRFAQFGGARRPCLHDKFLLQLFFDSRNP